MEEMSSGESNIREASLPGPWTNPATKVSVLFEEGNSIVWTLEKPWQQRWLFLEIGLLAAKYDLGIEFDFLVGDEGDETVDLLKLLKYWVEADLSEGDRAPRPEEAKQLIARIETILGGES